MNLKNLFIQLFRILFFNYFLFFKYIILTILFSNKPSVLKKLITFHLFDYELSNGICKGIFYVFMKFMYFMEILIILLMPS